MNKERTNQYRFYSKILCSSEQALYHELQFAGLSFENYVWLLWSVKESAYKYLKRNLTDLVFSPTKIVIQLIETPCAHSVVKSQDTEWDSGGYGDELYSGSVNYGPQILYFRSKVSGEWITSVVNGHQNFENVKWGIRSIDNAGYQHQSKAARTLLLNKLNTIFPGNLQVQKNPVGYPVILKGAQDMRIPASLAHDGRFVAYSFINAV